MASTLLGLWRAIRRRIASRRTRFSNSHFYWDDRYRNGRTSGAGSYGRLAYFKAEVLNDFVRRASIHSIVEFGSGDGAQLTLCRYDGIDYLGLDVSPAALDLAREANKNKTNLRFELYDSGAIASTPEAFAADLSLSLDVIYHLVEDSVYHQYMQNLFKSAKRYVIVYSSDKDEWSSRPHVRHRRFTAWVEQNAVEWRLTSKIQNRFPFNHRDPDNTSFADFYIYQRFGSSC